MSVRVRITGEDRLVARLRRQYAAEKLRPYCDEAARILEAEVKRLAPRETGELEAAVRIVVLDVTEKILVLGVGVPDGDPAHERGMATEYGTRAIVVGTPESPVVAWHAKTKDSASMPWLRAAMLNVAPQVRAVFERAIKELGDR